MQHHFVLVFVCASAGCSVDRGGTAAPPRVVDIDIETDGGRPPTREDAGRLSGGADRAIAPDAAAGDTREQPTADAATGDVSLRPETGTSVRDTAPGDIALGPDTAPPAPDTAPLQPDTAPLQPDTAPAPDTAPLQPDTAALDERALRCPADSTLALCLRFEASPIVDDSPRAHVVNASSVQLVAGPSGNAASVGAGSVLHVPEVPALNVSWFTLEAWVNARSLPGVGLRAGVIDNDGQYSLFVQAGGGASCSGGGAFVFAPNLVRVGVWTSISCTLDRRNLTIWRDGEPVASVESQGEARRAADQGTSVGSNNPMGANFDGLIDNVRIWRSSRSAREICQGARNCTLPGQ